LQTAAQGERSSTTAARRRFPAFRADRTFPGLGLTFHNQPINQPITGSAYQGEKSAKTLGEPDAY
ncbi:MAG: hypothetical protein PUB71_07130, partial [Hallerella succinigenes]|uniref:hypothetical protein n=1 Tax=Hallerella succinigenes TaxID=1896222 RepID=UPI0023F44D86